MEVLRAIILALNDSADELLFDPSERGPKSRELKLQFEAVSQLDFKDKEVIRTVIDSLLLRHDTQRRAQKSAQLHG